MTLKINLYQIAYDSVTLQQVQDSGFLLLDNRSNERPDWYEYWPIRQFLLRETLEEDAFYGFFSPKFTDKTQMTHVDVCKYIGDAYAKNSIDVALFCPQSDMGANFLNVFEQAEVFDPGFIAASKAFLLSCGINLPIESMVMDSRQIVFSNYFVAKPAFWREWFGLAEALFGMAEDPEHPLRPALCHGTTYSEDAQRKVFISERLASLILCMRPHYKVAAANPFNFGWSMSRFREFPEDAYINDALKIAFKELGFPQYMDAFRSIRSRYLAGRK